MRRGWLTMAIAASACGYPSFSFNPEDTAVAGEDSAIDSTTNEDAPETTADTAPADTSVDTTSDDTTLDDNRPDDTTPDVVSESITTPGCAGTKAVFCDDYDTASLPQDGWDGTNLVGAGAIALDTMFSSSPPNSFLSVLGVSTATENSATMDKVFVSPTPGALAMLDVWIRVDLATNPDGIQIFKIQGHGTGKGVGLLISDTGLVVETVGAPGMDYPVGIGAPIARFAHYRMETTLVSTSARVTLWIDDMTTPVFDRTDLSTASVVAESNYQVIVGDYCAGAVTTATSARFDDVSFSFP